MFKIKRFFCASWPILISSGIIECISQVQKDPIVSLSFYPEISQYTLSKEVLKYELGFNFHLSAHTFSFKSQPHP